MGVCVYIKGDNSVTHNTDIRICITYLHTKSHIGQQMNTSLNNSRLIITHERKREKLLKALDFNKQKSSLYLANVFQKAVLKYERKNAFMSSHGMLTHSVCTLIIAHFQNSSNSHCTYLRFKVRLII